MLLLKGKKYNNSAIAWLQIIGVPKRKYFYSLAYLLWRNTRRPIHATLVVRIWNYVKLHTDRSPYSEVF